ncbi:MAG: DUF5131 family protein [Tychonema bourrellyi B0820]|nr:DUF5131 family protein [Tychonema bourrellyi B0820]PJE45244.1 MAG: phage Gp37/Gp68 family protein [Flavobacterium sp.] [Flavobacterium sp. FEMGT703F]
MSKIEWTDITSNPIHLIREDGTHGGHWCEKISPGCANCYAETQNQSNYFKFASHLPYSGDVPDNLIFDEKVMQKLVKMRSPEVVFLGSMTDIFGKWVPDEWLDRAFAYMAVAKQHTFQILTKRPERMKEYLTDPKTVQRIGTWVAADLKPHYGLVGLNHSVFDKFRLPLPNVWLGTSVENQKAADDRIPSLLMTPAAVRFLSCEPLLERLNFSKYVFNRSESVKRIARKMSLNEEQADSITNYPINWVIVGGESGSKARPCHLDWIRSIVQQCRESNIPVFVKQLGSNCVESVPYMEGICSHHQIKTSDRKGGDIYEFPEDLRIREFPFK